MSQSPNAPRPDSPLPPELRFLRRLVTTLTVVMILGLVTVIGLLVTRITAMPVPFGLPDAISLPPDSRAQAVTLSRDWVLVLSDGDELLLFDRVSGALRHQITLPEQ